MSDPWRTLPNLSGQTAPEAEGTREADQARMYPSVRGGVQDAITRRILDVPRVRAYNSVGEAGHGPGFAFVGMNGTEWDTDHMWQGGPYLTCVSPGCYGLLAAVKFSGGAAANDGQWARFVNPAVTRCYGETTTYGNPAAFGTYMMFPGIWNANVGDQVGLYVYTASARDIVGGSDNLWIAATLLSTSGGEAVQ